jgi:hypothetical protein
MNTLQLKFLCREKGTSVLKEVAAHHRITVEFLLEELGL